MATEAIIFQQIVDINWDQAIYTASPNNTVNVVQFAAKGSGTNIGIALTPKGTGFISAHVPDNVASGGNTRGASAVDLQIIRGFPDHVASGQGSAIIGGRNNRSTGQFSVSTGSTNLASGDTSFCTGNANIASGIYSTCLGSFGFAGGDRSTHLGTGASAHRWGMVALGLSASFSTTGDNQFFFNAAFGRTTTNAAAELLVTSNVRIGIRAGTVNHCMVFVTGSKSDGSAVATYMRQVTIKRVGNTTSLVGTVNTIGTDEAAGTSISITADDTNDSLKIQATGISGETWRWYATVMGQEMVIGA